MGTNCLIRCGVVLLVADDQRSSFMTNGHLPPVGVRLSFVHGSSVLHPRLATLAVSRYSGSSVSHTWRSASYGGLVFPLSEVRYIRCVSIVWESQFPYLAVAFQSSASTPNGGSSGDQGIQHQPSGSRGEKLRRITRRGHGDHRSGGHVCALTSTPQILGTVW